MNACIFQASFILIYIQKLELQCLQSPLPTKLLYLFYLLWSTIQGTPFSPSSSLPSVRCSKRIFWHSRELIFWNQQSDLLFLFYMLPKITYIIKKHVLIPKLNWKYFSRITFHKQLTTLDLIFLWKGKVGGLRITKELLLVFFFPMGLGDAFRWTFECYIWSPSHRHTSCGQR